MTSTMVLQEQPTYFPGYKYGLRQPCLVFRLGVRDVSADAEQAELTNLAILNEIITAHAPPSDEIVPPARDESGVAYLLFWMRCLLKQYQQPILAAPHARRNDDAAGQVWNIVFPCVDRVPTLACLSIAIKTMAMLQSAPATRAALETAFNDLIAANAPHLKPYAIQGFNPLHFLSEANRLGIPWFRYSNEIFQLGQGARSRLLNSSIVDTTSHIAVKIARDKEQCSVLLQQAGLPVPAQLFAGSADAAVAAADKLGFPVVVKPADKDGGVGVSAFLHDADSVRAAFDSALKVSNKIVVEKYVQGNDYRIQVVGGVVHGVLERSPGGVNGDGRHTVRELVERQNAERASATDERRFLHRIELDAEAVRMLGLAGLAWDAVPAAGQFVRLRGAANVAGGGIPREIPLGEVHPDNIALAIRTARVLRLDVAGIDFLTPDIRRSWLESECGICEVNAQPQMFTTMHAPLLQAILPRRQGRIPTVVVLTAADAVDFNDALYAQLREAFPNAGLVTDTTIALAGRRLPAAGQSVFQRCRSLLIDQGLDALLIAVGGEDPLTSGWPIDRCDALLIVGGHGDDSAAPAHLRRLIFQAKALQPGLILVDAADDVCVTASRDAGLMPSNDEGMTDRVQLIEAAGMGRRLLTFLSALK